MDEETLPRIRVLCDYWSEEPPVHELLFDVARFFGAVEKRTSRKDIQEMPEEGEGEAQEQTTTSKADDEGSFADFVHAMFGLEGQAIIDPRIKVK